MGATSHLDYQDSKDNVLQRFESWMDYTKADKGSIGNLRSQFRTTFKKIEYVKREPVKLAPIASGSSEEKIPDETRPTKSSIVRKAREAAKERRENRKSRGKRRNSANIMFGDNRNCSRISRRPSTRDTDLMLSAMDGTGSFTDSLQSEDGTTRVSRASRRRSPLTKMSSPTRFQRYHKKYSKPSPSSTSDESISQTVPGFSVIPPIGLRKRGVAPSQIDGDVNKPLGVTIIQTRPSTGRSFMTGGDETEGRGLHSAQSVLKPLPSLGLSGTALTVSKFRAGLSTVRGRRGSVSATNLSLTHNIDVPTLVLPRVKSGISGRTHLISEALRSRELEKSTSGRWSKLEMQATDDDQPGPLLGPGKKNWKSMLQGNRRDRRKSISTTALNANLDNQLHLITPHMLKLFKRRRIKTTRLHKLCRNILCIVRLVTGCSDKLKERELEDTMLYYNSFANSEDKGEGGGVSQFSPTKTFNALSTKEKRLLRIGPEYRSQQTVNALMRVVYRLPTFFSYSQAVKRELARYLHYAQYDHGRVVIRQGDIGQNMYFIVSGKVSVYKMTTCKSGKKYGAHLMDLTGGSTFGEVALMKETKRMATVVTNGSVEFLVLDREEFKHILSDKYENDYLKIRRFFFNSKYFKSWSKSDLEEVASVSSIHNYTYNQVVIGNIKKFTDTVYFIRKGECDIVQTIHLNKPDEAESPKRAQNLKRPPMLFKTKENDDPNKYTRHLITGTLGPGDYMGAGENLEGIHYVAKGKVQIIQINTVRYKIFSKFEELRQMGEKRNAEIMSPTETFKRYIRSKKWFEYRQQVARDCTERRTIPNPTTIDDVPKFYLQQARINTNSKR